jgi:uroporphyrinogen decarboxylase
MRLIEYISGKENRLVYPWMNTIALRLMGYQLYDVYESAKKQLEAAKIMDDVFAADFVYPLDDGVLFQDTLKLLSTDFIRNVEDIEKLKTPDPYKDGRMPTTLEGFRLISKNIDKPLAVSIVGPFTLAAELADVTTIARSIIRNPDFVYKLLDFTTKIVSDYAAAAAENGVKLICISDPTGIILSPKKFEELVASNLRKIFEKMGEDVWKVIHICGDTTHLLDQMLNCGAEGLSLDQLVNLPEIAKKVPKDVVLIGNLDPIHVLAEMSPQQIEEKVLELLRDMNSYPNYIFSYGCDCLPDTPIENLKASIKAGHTKLSDLFK